MLKPRYFTIGVWSLAFGFLIVGWLGFKAGLLLNTTPSVPIGLWQVQKLSNPLHHDQIVSICPPDKAVFRLARQRGYVPSGNCQGDYEPLLKPVAAIAGDMVTVTPSGIRVNGRIIPRSRPQRQDASGQVLPKIRAGDYRVPLKTVWLISSGHTDGFDSRYFGPVPTRHIQGVARPIWIGGQP